MRFIKLIFHRSHRIYKKTPDNSGQAFLIVVLIMVIALTVGLSIASRTVTNLKMGSEEANSQKAFSAAEAGVEQYLQAGSTNPSLNGTSFNNGSQITNISRTYEGQGATSTLLNNGDPVSRDEGADIWLNKFDSNPANLYTTNWSGTFKVYWGDYTGPIAPPSTQFCSFAAVELIVITGPTNWRTNPTQLSMTRYPVENGCSSGRTRNFPLPNSAGVTNFNNAGVNSGINFLFANSFTVSNVLFA
ncbi:MAG: hypothetical protein KGJ07_09445, partial [Patescibacteria group bacterium]|nr:hypothetical protein [Patescibacteria group bacterium]